MRWVDEVIVEGFFSGYCHSTAFVVVLLTANFEWLTDLANLM